MIRSAVATFALLARALAAEQQPDAPTGLMLRLEVATLNPDHVDEATLAFGASAGYRIGSRHSVFVRYTAQQPGSDSQADITTNTRHFVGGMWQLALGSPDRYRRQVTFRLGAGALLRSGVARTAPFAGGGLAVRYPVPGAFAFLGSVEDEIAWLPRQVYERCFGPFCDPVVFEARTQHNFGLFVAAEWSP